MEITYKEAIQRLIEQGCNGEDIMKNLGMDADEVLRLKQNSGVAELFSDNNFSKSWK